MSLINIKNLTFSYDGSFVNVFENISLTLDTDWKLGFVGRNGRGKTTFLKLLLGGLSYSGSITADVRFEYFPYQVAYELLTPLELIEKLCPDCEIWQVQRETSLLGIDEEALYRPLSSLSGGERTKILLAAMFLRENNFLLIDEPTNHLDEEARALVSSYLARKKGYILVSHDRSFLDGCVDHIMSINITDIEVQKGNYSSWMKNKEMRDNFEISRNEKLKKDITRLTEAAQRTANWSDEAESTKYATRNSGLRPDRGYIGHKAAKMMTRSKSIQSRREEAAEEKSKLLKNIEESEELKIHPLLYHSKTLLELYDVTINYGEGVLFEPVRFMISCGDRIALTGGNGSGKSSILKLIYGEDIPFTGRLTKNGKPIISYVPQTTASMKGTLREYASLFGIDYSLFLTVLRKLDFSRNQFDMDISSFSEGQKKKTAIARSLCEKAHLYIWDEPLNYIDLLSRIQLEELILDYEPTIIFVEHDAEFRRKIATSTIILDRTEEYKKET